MNASDPFSAGDDAAGDSADRLGLMRRVAIAMFVTGGATAGFGVEITARTAPARWTQAMCAAGLFACGLILAVAPARRRLVETSLFVAIGVLGALMAGSNPTGMAPLFYLWPMVYAAYFCSRRLTSAGMAWSAVTLGAGLMLNPHQSLKMDTFIGTVSSVGLMTALVFTMTQREERLRSELASIAHTDSLTGLLNRRAFDRELAAMIEQAAVHGQPLSMVMFDLDHFKEFNDRHGHLAGDDALRTMASVLRSHARAGDALGRFGGEEFTVVLANADLRAARSYADRVARHLSEFDDPSIQQLSTSAGISVFSGTPISVDLIAQADEALYAAKAAGRARFAWFDGDTVRLSGSYRPAVG